MSDQQRFVFTGTGGPAECQEFIRFVRQQAVEANKARDNDWIADYAASCITGNALTWFETLDEEVSLDWKLLRQALLAKYNDSEPESSIIPTPAAASPIVASAFAASTAAVPPAAMLQPMASLFAAPPSIQSPYSRALVNPRARFGRIRVEFDRAKSGPSGSDPRYIAISSDEFAKNWCILTSILSDVAKVERTQPIGSPGERLMTKVGSSDGVAIDFEWQAQGRYAMMMASPNHTSGIPGPSLLGRILGVPSQTEVKKETSSFGIASDGLITLEPPADATASDAVMYVYSLGLSKVQAVLLFPVSSGPISFVKSPKGHGTLISISPARLYFEVI